MNLLDLMVKVGVDDRASDKIASMSSGITGAVGGAAKAVGVGVAAAAAGLAAVTKASLDGYSAYEQNVGGIQKLYGNMGKSLEDYAASVGQTTDQAAAKWQSLQNAQTTMLSQAQNAFATCGMSANQYMEQATSFSAALISSLGGDTERAAAQTQKAMVAMSDNVNTFGSDMQDVQNAFQGFAKQNYTMLDNLKLGYGGTKEEMERLISDANDYARSIGQAGDLSIDSFSDIVDAIDLVQQKQQIAGTTSREAATTIEGSVSMMRAAWENWVASLGSDDWDVGTTTANLVESVEAAASNVIPRVAEIVSTIVGKAPSMVASAGPALASALGDMVSSALEGVANALPNELTAAFHRGIAAIDSGSLGQAISSVLNGAGPAISEGLAGVFENLSSIADNLPLDTIGDTIQTVSDVVGGLVSNMGDALPLIAGIAGGFVALQGTLAAISGITGLVGFFTAISAAFTPMSLVIPGVAAAIALVAAGFTAAAASGADVSGAFDFVSSVLSGLQTVLDNVGQVAETYLVPALSDLGGQFSDLLGALSPFVENVLAPLASFVGGTLVVSLSAIIEMIAGVLDVVTGIIGGVTQLAEAFTQAPEAISSFVDQVGSFLGGLAGSVAGWLGGVLASFGSWASGVIDSGVQAGSQFVSSVGSFLMGLPGSVSGWLGGVISTVAGWVGQFGANAASAASTFGQRLRDGLAAIPGTLGNIGSNIIQGIVNGITGAAGRVKDAIGNAIGGAVDFAKHILGIASPSKVFKRFGYYTMEGMRLGIEQNAGLPLGAAERAMAAVADAGSVQMEAPDVRSAAATASVVEWLDRRLGDVIETRTPYVGMREYDRMARRAVAHA